MIFSFQVSFLGSNCDASRLNDGGADGWRWMMMDDDGDTFSSWRQISIYLNTYIYMIYIHILFRNQNKHEGNSKEATFIHLVIWLGTWGSWRIKNLNLRSMLPLLPAHQFAIGASRFWPGTNCHLCERSTDSKRAWQKQQESVKTWVGTCQVRKLNKTNLVKHGFHTFLRCWGLDGKLGKNKPPLCKILADLGVSKFQIFDFQGVQALRRTRYKEALTEIIKHVDTCCASQIICVSAMCAVSIYKSINL